MLCAFGHRVATCCDVLGVVGSNLTIFKPEPTTPNMSQHVATRWPNARNMLRPTMLRYVALACCDRLAGALAACLKTENDKNLFIKISNRYGALRCFVFSVVSTSDDITSIHV